MKSYQLLRLLLGGLLMIPGIARAEDAPTVYTEISSRYEAIRLSLLTDNMDGLSENSHAIREEAEELLEDLSAAAAGVPEQNADDLDAVLQEIGAAAVRLADASDLNTAREGFFALTKPMAKYRKLAEDDHTIVAYCPMAQKAWIQPEGEIGNPYMGQKMPKCGELVGE